MEVGEKSDYIFGWWEKVFLTNECQLINGEKNDRWKERKEKKGRLEKLFYKSNEVKLGPPVAKTTEWEVAAAGDSPQCWRATPHRACSSWKENGPLQWGHLVFNNRIKWAMQHE